MDMGVVRTLKITGAQGKKSSRKRGARQGKMTWDRSLRSPALKSQTEEEDKAQLEGTSWKLKEKKWSRRKTNEAPRVKPRVPSRPRDSTPRYIHPGEGKLTSTRKLCTKVHSSAVPNSQIGTTQCPSADKWRNKTCILIQWISFNLTKELCTETGYNVDEP